jgi:hypothetical protein
MSDYTIVEKYQQTKSKVVAVRPYFDSSRQNMGLEKYGMALHDGVYHEESLACLELNGVKRFVTGLNEFAPDVKLLPPAEKEVKVKEIRNVVAQLEKELAANVIDVEDKEFWNKVVLLKPDNDKFWSRISLRCGNDPVYLDPEKDPYDLIKLYAINAGGFSIIAKSLKAAKKMINPPKFYLDQVEETIGTRTEYAKVRNKALAELQKLYDKDTVKLMYVAKVIDADSTQYTKSTPNDIIYENMDNYINGAGVESNKQKAAEAFLEVSKESMQNLKIRALVKDALFYRYISSKPSGWIEMIDSGEKLGKRPSEVVEYLKNPQHDDALTNLMSKVEVYWNM